MEKEKYFTRNGWIQVEKLIYCKDNRLRILGADNKWHEYIGINVSKVIVGKQPGEEGNLTTAKDGSPILPIGNVVYDGREVYNMNSQRKWSNNALAIDLRTGGRGEKFPGAKLYGETFRDSENLWASKNDDPNKGGHSIITFSTPVELLILDMTYEQFASDVENPIKVCWCKCSYTIEETEYIGYIRREYLINRNYK